MTFGFDTISPSVYIISGILLFLGALQISIHRKMQDDKLLQTVTKLGRGTWAERDLVLKLLKHGIPAETIFHDLYLKTIGNNYAQIDLVIITNVGVIVIEVKDYSGWIFGNGRQTQWTKVLAYGREKYRFYNPIMQNSKHIDDLKSQIRRSENIPFYSIVVFYGDCVLKNISFVPNGTFLVTSERLIEVIDNIMSGNVLAQYMNEYELVRALKEAVQNGENMEIRDQHIKNVQDMLGKHRIFD
jgi:hypothetical protein